MGKNVFPSKPYIFLYVLKNRQFFPCGCFYYNVSDTQAAHKNRFLTITDTW
jgi:hypothetical protein